MHESKAAALENGQVLLLENLRFNPGETSKDESERQEFAAQLAALADDFVSDGFGVVHRKQASVYDIAAALPHYAGSLVRAEVEVSDRLLNDPKPPFTVVLGGSKVSDKLGVIDNLIDRADNLLIGGGMVFTFLAALGHDIGSSLVESDRIDDVKGYLDRSPRPGERASCCPPTSSWRPRSLQTPSTGCARSPNSRTPRPDPTDSDSTSGKKRLRPMQRSSGHRRRCSGTAPWASSNSRRSPPERRPSRRR
jgi:hypothetical protein